jgi:hypothetical protein
MQAVISPSPRRIIRVLSSLVAVTLAMAYPEAKMIHHVFGPEMARGGLDRFTVHYTPTHGSWLNQAKIWNRRMNATASISIGSSTAGRTSTSVSSA